MSWCEKLERNVRLGVEIRSKCTTQSKKWDRNIGLGVRNYIEIFVMELEMRTKCTTWSKKLDRNVRHGVRNQNEMYDLE